MKRLTLRRLDPVEREFIEMISAKISVPLIIQHPVIHQIKGALNHLHPEDPIQPIQVLGYISLLHKRKACVCTR